MVKNPGNGRLNNLNDLVLNVLKYKLWVEDNPCNIFSTNRFVSVMQGRYRYYNQYGYEVYFPGERSLLRSTA